MAWATIWSRAEVQNSGFLAVLRGSAMTRRGPPVDYFDYQSDGADSDNMIQIDHSQAVQRSSSGLSRHSSAPATFAILGVNLAPIRADCAGLAGYAVS